MLKLAKVIGSIRDCKNADCCVKVSASVIGSVLVCGKLTGLDCVAANIMFSTKDNTYACPANEANGVLANDDIPNIYSTTHLDPEGTVITTPAFNVIGPADIALEPLGIEYETVAVLLFTINGCDALIVVPVTVVVAAIEPGAIKVLGVLNVTAPVDADAVIWLAVPARLVTPDAGAVPQIGDAPV